MATTVYTVEEIELQDGKTALLKPLVIKKLRRFMKMLEEMSYFDDDEKLTDCMLNMAAFCISTEHPEYWNEKVKNGTIPNPHPEGEDDEEITLLNGRYTEEFEEAVDQQTLAKIIEVCGGVNFNNPELLRAAAEAQAAQAGMTSN